MTQWSKAESDNLLVSKKTMTIVQDLVARVGTQLDLTVSVEHDPKGGKVKYSEFIKNPHIFMLGFVSYCTFQNLLVILTKQLYYRPFHKTLLRSSAFVIWISVRFYETGCSCFPETPQLRKVLLYLIIFKYSIFPGIFRMAWSGRSHNRRWTGHHLRNGKHKHSHNHTPHNTGRGLTQSHPSHHRKRFNIIQSHPSQCRYLFNRMTPLTIQIQG